MKMYKWYFEGQEIRFISSEDKMDKHVLANRTRFDQPDAKIIIENEYFDSSATPSAPCSSCGATTTTQSTLPVDNKQTKVKSKTVQLQPVSGDVVPTPATDSTVEDNPDLELLGGTSDRVAL
jgi:hypothetical protein